MPLGPRDASIASAASRFTIAPPASRTSGALLWSLRRSPSRRVRSPRDGDRRGLPAADTQSNCLIRLAWSCLGEGCASASAPLLREVLGFEASKLCCRDTALGLPTGVVALLFCRLFLALLAMLFGGACKFFRDWVRDGKRGATFDRLSGNSLFLFRRRAKSLAGDFFVGDGVWCGLVSGLAPGLGASLLTPFTLFSILCTSMARSLKLLLPRLLSWRLISKLVLRDESLRGSEFLRR